jgi:hypothetical protein
MIKRGDRYLYLNRKDFINYCDTLSKELQGNYNVYGMPRTIKDKHTYRCVSYKGQPVLLKGAVGIGLTKEEFKFQRLQEKMKGDWINAN